MNRYRVTVREALARFSVKVFEAETPDAARALADEDLTWSPAMGWHEDTTMSRAVESVVFDVVEVPPALVPQRVTLAALRAHCRRLRLTVRKRDGEYRVTLRTTDHRQAERMAYYTNDIKDAWETAAAMATEPAFIDVLKARKVQP